MPGLMIRLPVLFAVLVHTGVLGVTGIIFFTNMLISTNIIENHPVVRLASEENHNVEEPVPEPRVVPDDYTPEQQLELEPQIIEQPESFPEPPAEMPIMSLSHDLKPAVQPDQLESILNTPFHMPLIKKKILPEPVEPKTAYTDACPTGKNRPPDYPETARELGLEGLVIVMVSLTVHGTITAIRIEKSSGHSVLDEEAIRAVSQWVFKSATRNGVPVESNILIPVRFRFQD